MKVLIVSDCANSQICGVTRKQNELIKQLQFKNHIPKLLSPDYFFTLPVPYFKQVRFVIPSPFSYRKIVKLFEKFKPEIVNIMTEGSLGLMVSIHCILKGIPYTTMRCTQFENYIPWLHNIISDYLYIFHSFSRACITPSPTLARQYKHPNAQGILNGCDTSEFTNKGKIHKEIEKIKGPKWLYVGRISPEKNIDAFVSLYDKLPGSFIIIGSGPSISNIKQSKNIYYLGWKHGKELSEIYRSCDVFVFPSKTDTFGQVMVEAMASGLPVAAYPVTGPIDVVKDGITGCLHVDLKYACESAYKFKNSENCIQHAKTFSWSEMCDKFLECQVVCNYPVREYVYSYIFLSLLTIYFFINISR